MKYRFVKYVNIYDETMIFYALETEGVTKTIDNEKFIEVTADWKTSHMVRADSLKPIGTITKDF